MMAEKSIYLTRALQHNGGGKAGARGDQRHLPPLKSPDSTVNSPLSLLRPY